MAAGHVVKGDAYVTHCAAPVNDLKTLLSEWRRPMRRNKRKVPPGGGCGGQGHAAKSHKEGASYDPMDCDMDQVLLMTLLSFFRCWPLYVLCIDPLVHTVT